MSSAPSLLWPSLSRPTRVQQLPAGLDAAWDYFRGAARRLRHGTAHFLRRADAVLALESDYRHASDAHLSADAAQLAQRFRRRRETEGDVHRALALLREVAARKLGERPFRVQLAGALACDQGCVCEMATGEGKTLVAALAATLAGWRGRGCHVVTVNDYLAERDAKWMEKLFHFCGLTVGCVQQQMPPHDRRRAYHADLTYTTNKEVTADFLRDRLVLAGRRNLTEVLTESLVGRFEPVNFLLQRGLVHAIVDEADSILLDEAVTPLIISGEAPNPEQVQCYAQAAAIAAPLQLGPDYTVDGRYNEAALTPAGRQRVTTQTVALGGVWRSPRRGEELITQALVAKEFFRPGKQYVIAENKIVIVDESTGRTMPDRTWRDGLHQAIEAKEKLPINPPKTTQARISFQRFFRLYQKLAGLTGTAVEGRREFWRVYALPVVVIPPNRPVQRRRHPDRCFPTVDAKWAAIVGEIRKVSEEGRPILIGTRSVKDSEHLSALLTDANLPHQVLNAVRHAEEAQIVARAGQPGTITVATNMAGRGTDIKLGRNVAELGGLHVIATERHAAGRIDRQLFGRAARQGDPGSAVATVCLDDDLLTRYAPLAARLWRRFVAVDSKGRSSRWLIATFDRAQRRAERLAFAQRRAVLRTDDWLDENLGFAGQRF